MAAIRNNQKKDWNSQETRLVFAHGEVLKDKSRNFAIFKMNLFAKTVNSRAYNQWTVIACCCGNSTIFSGEIKIRWKWPCLEFGVRYTVLFCRHVFTFFRKCQLLSVSLTLCFISKINYKNESWYHTRFHLPGLHPHRKKKSPGRPVKLLFYLIQTKYYFLFQMLQSP